MELPIPKVTLPVDEVGILVSVPEGYEAQLSAKGIFERSSDVPVARLPKHLIGLEWIQGPAGPLGPDVPEEVRQGARALETYYIDNNSYPPRLQSLTTPIAHLQNPSPRYWEKYKYDTNHFGTWNLGYEKRTVAEEKVTCKLGQGAYYRASSLRGDEQTLNNLLTVRAEIARKRTGFNFGSVLLVIIVLTVLFLIGRRLLQRP